MSKILIIEDDKAIRMGLDDDLKADGYEVDFAFDGPMGLEKGQKPGYGLILLDLMLPGMDGLDVCKELRRKNISTPIIMLTAKSQDLDKVIGLELGADDYITKPFHSHELRARIKAVLRRSSGNNVPFNPVINAGPYELDISKYKFKKDGKTIDLTSIEFELLKLLITHPGEVIKRERILNEIWGDDVYVTQRTVDAHIAKLRRKMGDKEEQNWIKCMRGVGYKFVEIS
ncbi:MAG: response regulator transcription factor [Bacteroidetes bacterium]|jgi:DNA-binding response OmpR family regulator|nr:response regulator transcription factor [Bacteroidota bacterium]MBT3750929.1 response regulator transcription factor [Bacteroidota bacterium]MBT4409286.1 response regulator transcription factor [Bacteroidota bacterium]MBT7095198.1 response regulator transcription factor [Bacteroidota bacterium]MBT7463879.1 response regulator transcription factor [Bacteroidota bacterium]